MAKKTNFKTYLVMAVILLGFGCTIAAGEVIYVDADATGANDGSSWANAYNYLQDALDAALTGDEIWVAEGTYKPDANSANPGGSSDREATFGLISGVGIYGGFTGGETSRDQRDTAANVTILSGDLDGNDVDVNDPCDLAYEPTRGENSYHVVTGSLTDATSVLDGFTVTAGNANGVETFFKLGGGLYNKGGSPTVTNCTFSGNCTDYGGGIRNEDSSPALINCTISGNVATFGGGMYNADSSPTATNCIFWGDEAVSDGNEIYNFRSDPVFSYCDIEGCGSSNNWDDSFGTDDGNNIDSDPCFVDIDNPAGPDANFGTLDDGLRLDYNSPCIDAADGNAAPLTDIIGRGRIDIPNVNNTGTGDPNYADIGAYEYLPAIVVMVWIDESKTGSGYYGSEKNFITDLASYRDVINSPKLLVVKSGCLVPAKPGDDWTLVLPEGYDPPPEISVEECNRPPHLNEFKDDFNDIRGDMVPDYLLLVVDNSGSMHTSDINDVDNSYGEFKNWVESDYGAEIVQREPTWCGGECERWVDEITMAIKDVLN